MAKREVKLDGLNAKVAELAMGVLRDTRAHLQQQMQAANAKLDQDLIPLREALGVAPGVMLNLDTDKDGGITASWDPEAIKPPQPPTGPMPPLRVLKNLKRKRKGA